MGIVKKILAIWILCTLAFSIQITAYAEEETIPANRLVRLTEDTDIKDTADDNAATVGSLSAGTGVISLEKSSDGWVNIKYQDIQGYVRISAVTTEPESGLDAEFDEISNHVMLLFETYQYAISRKKQRFIWGTVIVLIVIAMFAVGIVSAVVKGKKESGETNELK